ncbi:hypothetical protein F7R91_34275 [Streptomyces luteolifulvus]|uniref:Uncharacterized protein n=1 Tax=Streptomyces luteolifulvus TaxID=2615112 RepID=A0A6H9URQ3_9ACTN|nr:hypothetical protein [Streptomyces luteolifulvus]KAB1140912.1 hypothetical protein F7R91_34275 [Streptomyces luteolifulvus]
MADDLKVLSDLKNKFAHYDDYQRCLTDLSRAIIQINKINKESAGQDEIGKTYHQQVDKPTVSLTETLDYVNKRLGLVVDAGHKTADIMANADEEAGNQSNGF